jgi:hypothetical protein
VRSKDLGVTDGWKAGRFGCIVGMEIVDVDWGHEKRRFIGEANESNGDQRDQAKRGQGGKCGIHFVHLLFQHAAGMLLSDRIECI